MKPTVKLRRRKRISTEEEWAKYLVYNLSYSRKERQKLLDQYGNKCCVCDQPRSRLEFHHLRYENGIHFESRFPLNKLKKAIAQSPQDFRLLCRMCHEAVTRLTDPIYGPRVVEIAKLTEPYKVVPYKKGQKLREPTKESKEEAYKAWKTDSLGVFSRFEPIGQGPLLLDKETRMVYDGTEFLMRESEEGKSKS